MRLILFHLTNENLRFREIGKPTEGSPHRQKTVKPMCAPQLESQDSLTFLVTPQFHPSATRFSCWLILSPFEITQGPAHSFRFGGCGGCYCLLRGWGFGNLGSENTHLGKEKSGGPCPRRLPSVLPSGLGLLGKERVSHKGKPVLPLLPGWNNRRGVTLCGSGLSWIWMWTSLERKLLFLPLSSLLGLGWRGSWRNWLC